jgi:hypothetical protein
MISAASLLFEVFEPDFMLTEGAVELPLVVADQDNVVADFMSLRTAANSAAIWTWRLLILPSRRLTSLRLRRMPTSTDSVGRPIASISGAVMNRIYAVTRGIEERNLSTSFALSQICTMSVLFPDCVRIN